MHILTFLYVERKAHSATSRIPHETFVPLVLGIGLTTKLFVLSGVDRLLEIYNNDVYQSKSGRDHESANVLRAVVMQN